MRPESFPNMADDRDYFTAKDGDRWQVFFEEEDDARALRGLHFATHSLAQAMVLALTDAYETGKKHGRQSPDSSAEGL
jgi:hypothetical protein